MINIYILYIYIYFNVVPRNHSSCWIYVLSILCSWFALLFFSSPLSRRCIRIPFSFRNPISGRCPVFPWISTAPNLLISRLLFSLPALPSLLSPSRESTPRYRSFHANMPSLFFRLFARTESEARRRRGDEREWRKLKR